MKTIFFSLALISAILTATNPQEEDYFAHLVRSLKESVCYTESLQVLSDATCSFLKIVPRQMFNDAIADYTYRRNYVLFSIYTTEFGEIELRYVGICGHFLAL
jgi:Domain of unknown function (DUF4359)